MRRPFVNFTVFTVTAIALALTVCSSDSNGDGDGNGDGGSNGGTGNSIVMDKNILLGTLIGEQTLEIKEYILGGAVVIKNGGRLNTPVETMVKAREGFSSYLLVAQGGKLHADDTADKPIVFTANSTTPTSGYWGGIIIDGRVPISGPNTNKSDTGLTEIDNNYKYGGSVDNNNSGLLIYVEICHVGARSTADIEHNGLTLSGIENVIEVENVYTLESVDDAVEFLGGMVNIVDLLVANPDDDMSDFTRGYSDKLKNCYGVWEGGYTSTEADSHGVGADGSLDGDYSDHLRRSDFTVENVTVVSNVANTMDNVNRIQNMIKIRRGTKATITNALVKDSGGTVGLTDTGGSKGVGNAASSISTIYTLNFKNRLNGTLNTFTEPTTNTGVDASLFTWSRYSFSSL